MQGDKTPTKETMKRQEVFRIGAAHYIKLTPADASAQVYADLQKMTPNKITQIVKSGVYDYIVCLGVIAFGSAITLILGA